MRAVPGADREDIRARLEGIAEELADLAMDRLRASIEEGDPKGSEDERRLTRARRAVEKAAALLADRPSDDWD